MLTTIFTKTSFNQKLLFAFIALLIASVAYPLREYITFDSALITGLFTAPFLLQLSNGKTSNRFLLPVIFFFVLTFFIHAKTFLFLLFIFCLLLFIENIRGKTSWLFFYLLLIISPLFGFFSGLIGFPLRLWLSEISGLLLNASGKEVIIEGNLIFLDGDHFSVDPACMGLKMLAISFILCLFLAGYFQKKYHLKINFIAVTILLLLTLILNIFNNLARIILLILFKILPDSLFHDIAGMMGLIVYVIIPLCFITGFIVKKTGKPIVSSEEKHHAGYKSIFINSLLITGILMLTVFHFDYANIDKQGTVPACYKKGFKKEILENGIIKLENQKALIYIKPLQFYSAEHNPMVCWSGSGYEFKRIKKLKIEETEVYYGLLVKENDTIYSAWWFDNGIEKTIKQTVWRWDALTTDNAFSLINVNTTSEEDLMIETKELIKGNLFANNNHENN